MSHLANGRVSIKFNNSVLEQKILFLMYSNFILNSCLVYELNNLSNNPSNDFTLKNDLVQLR